jgi:hypothetical protein
VASNYRKLGGNELCRLLNSTPLGPVITTSQLNRHRDKAGLRIHEGRFVDLFRYLAWLISERHKPKPLPEPEKDPYELYKERQRAKMAAQAESGREIAPLPLVVNPERRAACRLDFQLFCERYFPATFNMPWSEDHLQVISKIEEAVLRGGLFAMAMPRASGKTSIAERATIWAMIYGHRDFVALVGSDVGAAIGMLDTIKAELDGNDLLGDDFPEVVYPITELDGIAQKANGQLFNGERTLIGWTAKEIILPTIPGSQASGAILKVAGLTGGIRGMKFKRPDGKTSRPSLVIIDDPQTDEAARSPSQCRTRESILAGAVLGMAGPGKKISGIMPCTVIAPGDMADSILNRDLHPDWNGTRTKMIYAFPKAEKLWEEYARIRADSLRADHHGREATEFYAARREAMDEGAVVAWPARHNPDELSAIQHAMNLRLRDERAFFAEYQNEPLPEQEARSDDLTADQIAGKINRLPRGRVPLGCQRVTAFIDVQASLLYYVVAAWEDDFTGYVLDYGTYPDQKRPYFTLQDAKHTLSHVIPASGLEGHIYGGLDALVTALATHDWPRDDGAHLRIERCLIDANWGTSTATIYKFCRQSAHSAVLTPSHGKYVGASSMPMAEYQKKPGDRVGLNWRLPGMQGKREVRRVVYDTNYWKSFLHSRLSTAMGDKGCLSLFGDKPEMHRLFADHLTAEYRIRTQGRGREIDEWKIRPERPDNHFLDCLAGSLVAASMQGVSLPETTIAAPPKKHRVTFADLRARQSGQRPPS